MSQCNSCGDSRSALQKAKAILEGTINFINRDIEVEKIALPRLEICKKCDSSRVLIKVGDKIVLQCDKCLCLCELKTRYIDEVCPLKKW